MLPCTHTFWHVGIGWRPGPQLEQLFQDRSVNVHEMHRQDGSYFFFFFVTLTGFTVSCINTHAQRAKTLGQHTLAHTHASFGRTKRTVNVGLVSFPRSFWNHFRRPRILRPFWSLPLCRSAPEVSSL